MKKLALLVLVLSLPLFTAACGGNKPIVQTPVPGYPCGYTGISCGNHMCCDEGQTCGIPHTASEGMCPFVGDDFPAFGAKRRMPAKQRPEGVPQAHP